MPYSAPPKWGRCSWFYAPTPTIDTVETHTGGELVRISPAPRPSPAIRRCQAPHFSSSAAKRERFDEFRRLLMSWPSGHFDMSCPPDL